MISGAQTSASQTPAFHVAGMGLWAPGYPTVETWLKGARVPAVVEPTAALLPPKFARRTSLITRACFEAFGQAAGGANPATLPTVFGTAYAELDTLFFLLRQLWSDGELSPARFANSVYNTASGYLSIATNNRGFTTTITAGQETAAMALLEAMLLIEDRGGSVVVVLADENPGNPFFQPQLNTLAVALHLSREPLGGRTLGTLGRPRQERIDQPNAVPPEFRTNPAGNLLPLLRGLLSAEGGVIPLSAPGGRGWVVELHPGSSGK